METRPLSVRPQRTFPQPRHPRTLRKRYRHLHIPRLANPLQLQISKPPVLLLAPLPLPAATTDLWHVLIHRKQLRFSSSSPLSPNCDLLPLLGERLPSSGKPRVVRRTCTRVSLSSRLESESVSSKGKDLLEVCEAKIQWIAWVNIIEDNNSIAALWRRMWQKRSACREDDTTAAHRIQ